jgi:hypothetical protein
VRQNLSPFANDPFFQQFFGQGFGGRSREQVVSSLGSGVIIDADGKVVTSHHVIRDNDWKNDYLLRNHPMLQANPAQPKFQILKLS